MQVLTSPQNQNSERGNKESRAVITGGKNIFIQSLYSHRHLEDSVQFSPKLCFYHENCYYNLNQFEGSLWREVSDWIGMDPLLVSLP